MPLIAVDKARVRAFWNHDPCGTRDNPHPPFSPEYFEWIEAERDAREPFIRRFARWPEWAGKDVLEMGVGAGTDFVRFARAGARVAGVDLSDRSVALTRERLIREGFNARLVVGDIENLAFPSKRFDFVYSWGVMHHTNDPSRAASEALRVLRPGGQFCVMLYHRWSLICLQAYLVYGVLRGRPRRRLDDIAAQHLESSGTKVYTERQARALFPDQPVTVTHVMTPYDLRYGRRRYLPAPLQRLVPSYFGYFMVLEGTKPGA